MADGSMPETRFRANAGRGSLLYGSVCDGMGAAHVASRGLGWQCAWLAENDPAASATTAYRHREVPNLGDITAPDFIDRAIAAGGLDMLAGGTPCQSFSFSGLRKGLDDARGNLTLRFVELADATGHAGGPVEVVFWENVEGVLSDKTNAFGCLIGALVGEDTAIPAPRTGWTNAGVVIGPARKAAWRLIDAQGFVAQRRRRVFVVAARHGSRVDPERVLLETEADALRHLGDRAHSGPLFPEREGVRRDTAQGGGEGEGSAADAEGRAGAGFVADVAPTIPARARSGGGLGTDFDCDGELVATAVTGNITHALNTANNGKHCSEDGTGRGVPIVATAYRTSPNFGGMNIADGVAVRRLTPQECLRLQSFPPDYFDAVLHRGKPLADGNRYKMIGNSWNTDTVRWIFRRIDAQWRGEP